MMVVHNPGASVDLPEGPVPAAQPPRAGNQAVLAGIAPSCGGRRQREAAVEADRFRGSFVWLGMPGRHGRTALVMCVERPPRSRLLESVLIAVT